MINISDIVKFSDYKDIYLESKDCFVYRTDKKKYNIKGANVEKYISPIFYKLFQPNFVFDLFQNIKDKFNGGKEDMEISKEDFLNVLLRLYKLNLVEVFDNDSLSIKKQKITDNFKMFNVRQRDTNNVVESKTITIINFLKLEDIRLLIDELKEIPFKKINLINFHTDILDITEEKIPNLDIQNIEITYQKHSNVLSFIKHLLPSDFLVTLHSAKNIEINSIMNRYSVRFNIPWLNLVVNDMNIEVGPLVAPKKTACYDCYQYFTQNQEVNIYGNYEDNIELPLRTYQIYRRSNLYIAFGYVLDEILKYFCYKDIQRTPITVNNIITINGLNLSYTVKPILRLPNCTTCGY